MSGTFRTGVVALVTLVGLITSSCSADSGKTAPEPEEYVKVCVIDGYYFADVSESDAERNAELYSEDKQPCIEADEKAAKERKRQASEERLQRQRVTLRTIKAVKSATAKVSGQTEKLFAIINLACRDEVIWEHHIYNVYKRAYGRTWYPSQAVAFPFELRGALRKSCPSQADLKSPYEYGGG